MRRVLAVEIGVYREFALAIKELKDEIGSLNEEVQFYKRIMIPKPRIEDWELKVWPFIGKQEKTDSNLSWFLCNLRIVING
ncbi:MAG: hypothetical protein CM1200mP24_01460 [Gammaproteobacteria bacterium]|nr:MAG: hypothetical protein CM1200mP24_01460 [Gammaproteobacteria bacterium]